MPFDPIIIRNFDAALLSPAIGVQNASVIEEEKVEQTKKKIEDKSTGVAKNFFNKIDVVKYKQNLKEIYQDIKNAKKTLLRINKHIDNVNEHINNLIGNKIRPLSEIIINDVQKEAFVNAYGHLLKLVIYEPKIKDEMKLLLNNFLLDNDVYLKNPNQENLDKFKKNLEKLKSDLNKKEGLKKYEKDINAFFKSIEPILIFSRDSGKRMETVMNALNAIINQDKIFDKDDLKNISDSIASHKRFVNAKNTQLSILNQKKEQWKIVYNNLKNKPSKGLLKRVSIPKLQLLFNRKIISSTFKEFETKYASYALTPKLKEYETLLKKIERGGGSLGFSTKMKNLESLEMNLKALTINLEDEGMLKKINELLARVQDAKVAWQKLPKTSTR